jgi:hypothetical protein
MKATPQELSAGSKYSNRTLLGNWAEELAVAESKLKTFKTRSEAGSLGLRKQEIKIGRCTEIVPHSFSPDGLVRFGDTVMLKHDATSSLLSCDPFEDLVQGQNRYLVTASSSSSSNPVARSVFRVVRPPPHLRSPEDDGADPLLKVGMAFCLECNESLLIQQNSNILAPMLYLASTKKNERNVTRNTNRQMVYMSPVQDAESVWFAIKPSKGKSNMSDRYLSIGSPLSTSEPFQLTHRQTNMYLTCDVHQKFMSEFGVELECYADRTALSGKLGLMVSEFKGLSTPQTLAKPDSPVYSWHFTTAADPNAALDARPPLPPKASLEIILSEIHFDIKSKGIDAFWNLRAYFINLDKQVYNEGKIDREDLKDALITWGVTPSLKIYFDSVIDLVDYYKTGLIAWADFLALLRGPLPAERESIVSEVFTYLTLPAGKEFLTADDLASYIVAKEHPLVTIGGASEKDALAHLIKHLSVRGRVPPAIRLEAFAQYYADLSAGIDDDSYFDQIVRGSWAV